MISAQVRRLFTIDMDDLESFIPNNPECFRVFIRAMVGPLDSEGEESFDVAVCTPKWIDDEVQGTGHLFQRAVLVVNHYNAAEIRAILTKKIESMSAPSWQELGSKISRLGVWEFEE